MTRRISISNTELKRFAEVANTKGVTIELIRDGTIVRVMPFHPSQVITQKPTREEKAEAALAKWIAERDAKRAKAL